MKRLLYLSYTAFSLAFLSSCQMGGIETTPVTTVKLSNDARTASCESYAYETKAGETIDLGPARNDVILVSFNQNLTLEERQSILQDYPFVAGVEGEVTMDSGIITRISLVPGITCFEAEKTIKKLEQHPDVLFANPAFTPSDHGGAHEWLGLSNEFIVSLESADALEQLEQLIKETNVSVVFSLSEDLHVLSADKNSAGNTLEMTSLFNNKDFVAGAEPNFIYYLTPVEVVTESQRTLKTQSGHE